MNVRSFPQKKVFAVLLLSLLVVFSLACNKVQVNDLGSQEGTSLEGLRAVRQSVTVAGATEQKMVDILLVIDDSGSMKEDSLALASRLAGFATMLEDGQFDWQMCLTTTNYNGHDGESKVWVKTTGDNLILKKTDGDIGAILTNTIDDMTFGGRGGGRSDERGVASIAGHLAKRNQHNCYRQNALTAVILISDENERSQGDNLENIDKPDKLIEAYESYRSESSLGSKLVVNSIIVQSGDTVCKAEQDAQPDSIGHYGTVYEELSQKTRGSVSSICSEDYAENLDLIYESIVKSSVMVQMQCVPVNAVQWTSSIDRSYLTMTPAGDQMMVENAYSSSATVTMDYQCAN